MKTRRITDYKGIALFLLLAALVSCLVFMLLHVWAFSMIARDIKQVSAERSSTVLSSPSPTFEPAVIEPVEQPAEIPAAEPVEVTEPVAPPAAAALPWAEEMATVGIAEADQPIVRQMVFTGYDWNVRTCACYQNVVRLISAESRLRYLDLYVTREHGSWVSAQAHAAQGRW